MKQECFLFLTIFSTIYDTTMVIMDTNILLSALRSSRGASFLFIEKVFKKEIQIAISVPLILEYEMVLNRHSNESIPFSSKEIKQLINGLCKVGIEKEIKYLWRPFFKDSKDDMVLELAIATNSAPIITFNKKDFKQANNTFGIDILNPLEYLKIKELLWVH